MSNTSVPVPDGHYPDVREEMTEDEKEIGWLEHQLWQANERIHQLEADLLAANGRATNAGHNREAAEAENALLREALGEVVQATDGVFFPAEVPLRVSKALSTARAALAQCQGEER